MALPAHLTLPTEAISNKLWLKLSYAMNIRQHKAVVNRHSSRSASQDIVITLIFKEVRHIKISKHQLIKEKAKAKPAATFKGMTICMHFAEGEGKKKASQ